MRQTARLVPMLVAGRADRLEERWFQMRHPPGGLAQVDGVDIGEALAESIRAGLGYLGSTQRSDGLWRGFMLAPGASTDWVSAHIAMLLEGLPQAQAQALRERAGASLLESGRRRPGWGYNRRVGIDSDSSSQAIIVLHSLGHEIEPAWVERLLATQDDEGGFGTFASTRPDRLPRTWWEMPHADVTLIVIEALARLERNAEERRHAGEWLSGQAADGVLPAYWWTSPAYSLWAQARAGFEPAVTARVAGEQLNAEQRPVYLAMLIQAALAEGEWSEPLDGAVRRLMGERFADGSWRCAPCLRTTRADHAGGFDAPGPVHADRYRVFSTAHAIAALALALKAVTAATRAAPPPPAQR
jgi:hypothetical protein